MICRKHRISPPAVGFFAGAVAVLGAVVAATGAPRAAAPDRARPELEKRYAATVQPFMRAYCASCHGKTNPKAQLDLSGYPTMDAVARDFGHWAIVLERLEVKQMPPEGARQPKAGEREAVVAWIRALRKYEADRNAGDPGVVPARRLSNAEYDYSIRDLTGMDLRPTREFPVDPANPEGFDNSGESLTISPALLKKYVQAARVVADHLVLKPQGFDFAPHPVVVETDRDKYSILRIIEFYNRQPTDLADYFLAAWRYRHRAALGKPKATLAATAAESSVSPGYLELVWKTLTGPAEKVGPIAQLQSRWNSLPAAYCPPRPAMAPPAPNSGGAGGLVRGECEALRDWVVALRKKVAWRFSNLDLPRGFSPGGQAFIMWKNRQYASHRRKLFPDALQPGGKPRPRTDIPAEEFGDVRRARTVVDEPDPELAVPEDEAARAPYVKSFEHFCSVFPDAFLVSERGRMHIDRPGEKGRYLSAGFHNMMGYFRDDTPLLELILDEKGRQELDRLWREFDFVAAVPERMHLEFIFYERAETRTLRDPQFDFARSEDKDATSEAKLRRLADVYLAKAKASLSAQRGDPRMIQAVEDHFRNTSATIRAVEKARAAAEPTHLTALLDFARRAYRRPLTDAERKGLLAFYRSLREKDGLSHEDAIRDSLVSILLSPNFLFRVDMEAASGLPRLSFAPSRNTPTLQDSITPLSDLALASRLSYFLWSSVPDDELLAKAQAGELRRPEVLAAQARRMLKDPKARALAVEFGGNWLDFRRFESHNAVDRERFPAFDDALRQAMFEEPVQFLVDMFQRDGSVMDLLYGRHTFVNAPLARHYGMSEVTVPASGWTRVENADRFGRGGLLPMAVFLTQNSPGLRTSPVKRGYWVVRRVLGEHIPPPPPVVPELPKDEGQPGEVTLRQALERHRAHPACSGCHARFDSFGLVFEGYGPVGERREKDLGGRPVDTRASFPGGSEGAGLAGLRAVIRKERQDDFLNTLCRKLLAYALGRSLLPSDDATVAEMRKRLTANDHRFGTLVETVVTSRQFRYRRSSGELGRP